MGVKSIHLLPNSCSSEHAPCVSEPAPSVAEPAPPVAEPVPPVSEHAPLEPAPVLDTVAIVSEHGSVHNMSNDPVVRDEALHKEIMALLDQKVLERGQLAHCSIVPCGITSGFGYE